MKRLFVFAVFFTLMLAGHAAADTTVYGGSIPATCSGNTCTVSQNIRFSGAANVTVPVQESVRILVPTDADDYIIAKMTEAMRITGAAGVCSGGTSAKFTIQSCSDADVSSCTNHTNEFTVASGTAPGSATVTDQNVAANRWLKLLTGEVTGSVTYCTVTITGTRP